MKLLKYSTPMAAAVLAGVVALPSAQAGGVSNNCSLTKGSSGTCDTLTSSVINGKRRTESFFVGINWNFGSKTPELVLGFRSLKTKANKKSSGTQLDLILGLQGGLSFDRVRLAYVGGPRSGLAQLGLGYSYAQKTPLVMAGVQAPYVHAGVDYLFTGSFLPYVGVNSLGRPKLPNGTSACANSTAPLQVSDFDFPPAEQFTTNGQTCFTEQNNN